MIRISLIIALLLIVFCVAFGRGLLQTTKEESSDEQAVRQVEDQIAAALGHDDADALDRLWASDYVFVNPGGVMYTKAQRLAQLRSGDLNVESYSRDEETIRIYGFTAVVIYRSTVAGQKTGQDISSKRRVTTVLVKRNNRWQAVSQQSTRIAQQ